MDVKASVIVFTLILSVSLTFCADTLKIEIIDRPDNCKGKAEAGDKISMHYVGTLKTGKKFDSSRDRNTPFTFQLGVGQVILGWDQGVPGMCIGEKRKLTCPPEYAYGDRGFGDIIPAKSTLVFEIELMDIIGKGKKEEKKETKNEEPKKEELKKEVEEELHDHEHPDAFESVDTDKNGEISRDEMLNYIKGYQEEDGNHAEQPEEGDLENLVGEIFQSDDKNKDGVLSKDEYYHAEEGGDHEDMAREMNVENEFKDEL